MGTTTSPFEFSVPTGSSSPIPSELDIALHIGDFVSLTSIANWIVEKISGVDLMGELGEWWAGDFSECVRVAEALTQLGEFCAWSGENIVARLSELAPHWEGRAGSDAQDYFAGLAAVIAAQQTILEEMATEYDTAAFGVYEGAQAVGDFVSSVIDYVIVAGIGALITALTGGLGSLFAGAGTAAAIVRIGDLVLDIIEIRGYVLVGIETALGVIATSTSAVAQFEDFAMPGTYNNQAV